MANDFRLLNEAYLHHISEANMMGQEGETQQLLAGLNNKEEIPDKMESIVTRLPINYGVCFSTTDRIHDDDAAINIEKWPARDEWYYKGLDNEQGEQELETDEDLRQFIDKHVHEYQTAFKFYTIYNLTSYTGEPVGGYNYDADPHGFDQRYGDYEQYGPDPGPSISDLQ